MKKTILIAAIASCTFAQAQNYKKVFYKDQTVENKEMRITIADAIATDAEVKFKLKIKNLTADYILYKPSESSFKIDGKLIKPDERPLVIGPNDDDHRVVNLKGAYKKAADYEFVTDGLYKINAATKGVTIPDFKLPASLNEITGGPFVITLLKSKKETARTDARFKVKYTGDKIAIFEPNKVAMKMPDGKEYANYHSDRKPQLLNKEEAEFEVSWKEIPKTSGDMQKVDMIILWRDAFKEITPQKIPGQTITVEFDKETTETKNK